MINDDITRSELIKEEQLSMTFDDPSLKEAVQKHESADSVDNSPDAEKGPQKENAVRSRPRLPQNPIKLSEPEPEPPKPLSDMEVMEHTASVWQYK